MFLLSKTTHEWNLEFSETLRLCLGGSGCPSGVVIILPLPPSIVCLALIKSMLWKTSWADLSDQGTWSITTKARGRAQCEHRCYCEIISTLLFLAMVDFLLLSNFICSFIYFFPTEGNINPIFVTCQDRDVFPHLSSGTWELDQVLFLTHPTTDCFLKKPFTTQPRLGCT